MKNLILIIWIFSTGCGKCQVYGVLWQIQHPQETRDSISFSGKTTVFIGNSITKGVGGVSQESKRWPTVFSTTKNSTENNLGVSGQTLENPGCGIVFNKTTIPTYTNQAALFFALGLNDIGTNSPLTTPSNFRYVLDSVLTYAITTKGWDARKIVLITPYWVETAGYTVYNANCAVGHVLSDTNVHKSFVAAMRAVATNRGTQLADVYSAMKGSAVRSTFISADGLHPNDTGAAFIAAYLAGIIFYL